MATDPRHTGQLTKAIVDRGHRGRKEVDGTEVLVTDPNQPGQRGGKRADAGAVSAAGGD